MGWSSFSRGITDVMQTAFSPWVAFYLFFVCNVLNYNINDIVLLNIKTLLFTHRKETITNRCEFIKHYKNIF